MKTTLYAAAILLAALASGCKKDNATTRFHVRLTDGPIELDKVNIDLRQVQIKFDRDSAQLVTMETKAGIYNLLALRNGVDTLVASGDYQPGVVKEIRLVLGNNNTVVENGVTYPLTIPSSGESGLKIKLSKQLRQNMDSLLVDFDAGLSVKKEQDGYKLRPVCRIK